MGQLADRMFSLIESAQDAADRTAGWEAYNSDRTLMPNDAIAIARVANIKQMCSLIEQVAEKGQEEGHSIQKVFALSIQPSASQIKSSFPYAGKALDKLIQHYGEAA